MASRRSSSVLSLDQARKVIDDELVPLLPGAALAAAMKPSPSPRGLALRLASGSLGLRLRQTDPYLFEITRVLPFSKQEIKLARIFLGILATIANHNSQFFWSQALGAAVRQTIVKSLEYPDEALLLRVLTEFEMMASQTYEGHRIAAAVGLDDMPASGGVELARIWGEDFGKVLTGSVETLITVSSDGYISEFRDLYTDSQLAHSPHYARSIAEWCTGGRLVVSLNRNGEILLFREKALVFAWRRGRWQHFVHDPIIRQMRTIRSKELRRCIYETCLDVSFARSGGCIGVVSHKHRKMVDEIVAPMDRVGKGSSAKTSAKTSVMTQILDQPEHLRRFVKLPRRLRQAIAAIDGALVLNTRGRILAVGAIVKVDPGSVSGARRAAARSLAKMGFGVKVSADGGIVGFEGDGTPDSVREVFEFA